MTKQNRMISRWTVMLAALAALLLTILPAILPAEQARAQTTPTLSISFKNGATTVNEGGSVHAVFTLDSPAPAGGVNSEDVIQVLTLPAVVEQ